MSRWTSRIPASYPRPQAPGPSHAITDLRLAAFNLFEAAFVLAQLVYAQAPGEADQ
jgi:hypothetical protein